jgi:flavodoxin
MNALIVYYSLSGTTQAVATALAKDLDADVEEIRCDRYSPSFWSRVRAGYESWKGSLPTINPLSHAPSHYELVVIGGKRRLR